MLIAMGIAAFLCIFNGTFYKPLYSILPYPALYEPYTLSHVVSQTELLFYSALAFTLLLLSGIYPAEMRAINIDFDWFYRKPLVAFSNLIAIFLNGMNRVMDRLLVKELTNAINDAATNATAQIAWALMSPFVKNETKSSPRQLSLKERVDFSFATGTSPVGLFAACAGLFIVMLFVFI